MGKGQGADGGSIPKRKQMVKMKAKEEKKDARMDTRVRYFYCTLSNAPLYGSPIVADAAVFEESLNNRHRGSDSGVARAHRRRQGAAPAADVRALSVAAATRHQNASTSHSFAHFLKKAIVNTLLEKAIPEELSYITGLKDVFDVHFTENPTFAQEAGDDKKAAASAAAAGEANAPSPWYCPMAMLEVGQYPFVANRSCGCIVSARALKEMEAAAATRGKVATASSSAATTSASSAQPSSSTAQATDTDAKVTCVICGAEYTPSLHLVALNPEESELNAKRKQLRQAAAERALEKKLAKEARKKEKKEKKSKKSKDRHADDDNDGEDTADAKKRRRLEATSSSIASATAGANDSKQEDEHAFSSKSSAYQSIFTSSQAEAGEGVPQRETFLCRNVLRR